MLKVSPPGVIYAMFTPFSGHHSPDLDVVEARFLHSFCGGLLSVPDRGNADDATH